MIIDKKMTEIEYGNFVNLVKKCDFNVDSETGQVYFSENCFSFDVTDHLFKFADLIKARTIAKLPNNSNDATIKLLKLT